MVTQIVVTVFFGVLITALSGGMVAGLLTEADRTQKWGGVGLCLVLIVALSLGIVAVWS